MLLAGVCYLQKYYLTFLNFLDGSLEYQKLKSE